MLKINNKLINYKKIQIKYIINKILMLKFKVDRYNMIY